MKIKQFLIQIWALIFYLILSIGAVMPFFSRGFFQIHDDVQVARIYEMAKSLSVGMFPVRWVQDLGYGLGYPIFNFYSVLPYYIGGFITLLGFDALTSTKIVFVLAVIASGISMFFLVKEFFGKKAALVASIIYLYFPYHAVNIFVRGDLAELAAYCFLPLVFLALFKIHGSDKISKLYIILGSISIAAVVLSHNLSAFMLFIFSGAFIVYSLISNKNRKVLATSYFSILTLAFLLSAFYAIPAVLEAKNTNILSVVGGGSNPFDHFVCPGQLWDSPWGFGGSAKGCIDGISFKLGKSNILLTVLGMVLAIFGFSKLREKKEIVFVSAGFLLFSLFMTLEFSSFLWGFPYMNFLQFPWRFLNFAGLFISIIIGSLVWRIGELLGSKVNIIFIIFIIIITVIFNIKLFAPQKILDRDASYYTTSYYLNWTASKISDEYLPKSFVKPKTPADLEGLKQRYGMFDFKQTPIEQVSNALSLIGAFALLLVIIGYGKKAS